MSYTDKNELFPIQILNMKGKCVVKVLCVAVYTNEGVAFFRAVCARSLWSLELRPEKDLTMLSLLRKGCQSSSLSSLKMLFNLPNLIVISWCVLPIHYTQSKNAIDQRTDSIESARKNIVHHVAQRIAHIHCHAPQLVHRSSGAGVSSPWWHEIVLIWHLIVWGWIAWIFRNLIRWLCCWILCCRILIARWCTCCSWRCSRRCTFWLGRWIGWGNCSSISCKFHKKIYFQNTQFGRKF